MDSWNLLKGAQEWTDNGLQLVKRTVQVAVQQQLISGGLTTYRRRVYLRKVYSSCCSSDQRDASSALE